MMMGQVMATAVAGVGGEATVAAEDSGEEAASAEDGGEADGECDESGLKCTAWRWGRALVKSMHVLPMQMGISYVRVYSMQRY